MPAPTMAPIPRNTAPRRVIRLAAGVPASGNGGGVGVVAIAGSPFGGWYNRAVNSTRGTVSGSLILVPMVRGNGLVSVAVRGARAHGPSHHGYQQGQHADPQGDVDAGGRHLAGDIGADGERRAAPANVESTMIQLKNIRGVAW